MSTLYNTLGGGRAAGAGALLCPSRSHRGLSGLQSSTTDRDLKAPSDQWSSPARAGEGQSCSSCGVTETQITFQGLSPGCTPWSWLATPPLCVHGRCASPAPRTSEAGAGVSVVREMRWWGHRDCE